MTFMNNSGEPLQRLAKFFNVRVRIYIKDHWHRLPTLLC